ncbi:MAG TPA: carbamoyltransferase HypF [Candidatus Dormibacteraeota bacterium]
MTAQAIARSSGPAAERDPGATRQRRRIEVRGVVQGVGFRPFVWRLARRLALDGFVCNTSGGVVIEAQGDAGALDALVTALGDQAPPLARVNAVSVASIPTRADDGFRIKASLAVDGEYQPVSPDAATCADCLGELFDQDDHRYRYPFINCTNCGPRFTIIEDIPYDRALTTMRRFTMCARCQSEYEDPRDRRFHAQPNACAGCGPRLWLADLDGIELAGDGLKRAAEQLLRGGVVAVKGLGGFQLACDATSETAVARLRERKHRPAKPFAVMVADLEAARDLCAVSDREAELLSGAIRPVVLLRGHPQGCPLLARGVAPGLGELGLMLPCTPLHHLLMREAGTPLVMSSGNLSEEPIARTNDEALSRLRGIADCFLLHDRDIHARYDDSVVRIAGDTLQTVRRARGLCPTPTPVDVVSPPVLALGGHLKNTFCVLKDGQAFVGPHIGDLDHPLTRRHQGEALDTYLRLFRAHPRVVACDLHPDYASTAIAQTWWDAGAEEVRVQHHHAHVASVMAEHGLRGRLLGVAFDGIGHGPDGTIWGGEFLLCDERESERIGHLAPVRQPGGDRCAREGWRMAVAYLRAAGDSADEPTPAMREAGGLPDSRTWRLCSRVTASASAAPLSTSAGRLFDAVASLLGVAHISTFEAEAAMRLEALAVRGGAGVAPIDVAMSGTPLCLDTPALVAELCAQRNAGRPAEAIAAAFHESLALAIARACRRLGDEQGVTRVALSGGVFQNALLLRRAVELLRDRGLDAYTNRDVPANDGGISLGQALVAGARGRVMRRCMGAG